MTNFFMFFHHLMTPQRETFDWVLFSRINHVVHLNYGVPDIFCLKYLVFDLTWSFFAKKKYYFKLNIEFFNPHQRLDHNMLDTQVGFYFDISLISGSG